MTERLDRRTRRQEEEDEALRAGRLPPGQSLTSKWPVLHATAPAPFDPATWRFRIDGLVSNTVELSWPEFVALPRVERTSDIHCVTRWSKMNNRWEGVRASALLALAGLDSTAAYVLVHAPAYSANLPLSALLASDTLFALRHDGQAIDVDHGGPVRLVVPSRYFWKSVKWVRGLEIRADDSPGFWETRGYHNDGDPFAEERFVRD